ncbi:ABC transporter permease [Haloferax namakaokahaiae]|uniref:ABC transporter permease n=1 Tax=Haloferax namakaokahaiae TaxID=1748331 RepID=A0ABD5ZDQ0_9EURY
MSVRSMTEWDARLQYRYGFYAIYAVVTALFIVGLKQLPASAQTSGLVLILFSDPGFLGFYFVGALVLFEKNEGVLDALVSSPLSVRDYLVSKAASLSFIALLGATTVALFVYGPGFDWVWFVLGIGLTAVVFTLLGFVAVARFDTLNTYFMTAILYLTPLSLPLLDFFGIVEHPLVYLFPTQASLVLITAAFEAVPTWELAYGVGYLVVWMGLSYLLARRAFVRHIVRGTGDGGQPSRRHRPGLFAGRSLGPTATLIVTDLRNWSRDPLLLYIGFFPILLGLLVRFGLSPLDAALTFVDLSAYAGILLAAILLLPGATFGFAAGIFMLEDREQGILQALRTTPLTGDGYLRYRGLVFLTLTFLMTLVVVPLVNLGTLSLGTLVALAAVGSFHTAVTGLLMASLASNTVEGVGVSKGLGFLIIGPMVALALVAEPLQFLAGVFPPFWVMKATVLALAGEGGVLTMLAVGVLYNALVIAGLLRLFNRRAD